MRPSRLLSALLFSILIAFSACTPKEGSQNKEVALNTEATYSIIAFYNVENLFDTIDDQNRDEEFIPGSKLDWDTKKYRTKLNHISRVIYSIDSIQLPGIVGLCEVENVGVIKDLLKTNYLKQGNYQIIHNDSPDERGIDNAMIYNPELFQMLSYSYIPVKFPFDIENKTRDILYVKGLNFTLDTLHIFVNHWTSRWGGQEKTIGHRNYLGKTLKRLSDSIKGFDASANIIITGDFNDNPNDESMQYYLNARIPEGLIQPENLYNLNWKQYNEGEGTLFWKTWDMFDQFVVSGNMLSGTSGVFIKDSETKIFKEKWMLYEGSDGIWKPSRTAAGRYYGGYSDHLPVYISLHPTVHITQTTSHKESTK